MDPLSLTASIIALIQFTQGVVTALRTLNNAPKEFSELKDHLCELEAALNQAYHLLEILDVKDDVEYDTGKRDEQSHGLLRPRELEGLKMTVTKIERVVYAMGQLVRSSSSSNGKLNRMAWTIKRNCSTCSDLLQESRRLLNHLMMHIITLSPMQMKRHHQEVMENFKTIGQQTATSTPDKTGLRQRNRQPSPDKPYLRRYNNHSVLKSLPVYTPKYHSVTDVDTKRTEHALYHTFQNKPETLGLNLYDDNNKLRQFPKIPSDKPVPSELESEKGAEAVPVAILEESITENSSEPTDILTSPQELVGMLDDHGPRQGSENPPSPVDGLLDFVAPPPPYIPDDDSDASQITEIQPRGILETPEPAVAANVDVTYPQYRPSQQPSYYRHNDFQYEHSNMYECSCPRATILRPPCWFEYLFGALVLAFCMPFLSGGLVCCNTMCQGKPKRYIRLDMQLPLWLADRICLSIFYWDNIHGLTHFLQWRKSRELENPEAVLAIEKGDLRWLQHQVRTKRLKPFDVLKGAGEPLAYSLANIESGKGFEITEFLFTSGFHSLSASYQGCNASYIARLKLKAGIDLEQRHVYSVLAAIADLDHNSSLVNSTSLHDAALQSTTSLGIRKVLATSTENINAFDGLGFTALHWSVMRENLAQVQVLLKAGADCNLSTTVQKWSPLHLACMRSSSDISTRLLEAGAKLELEDFKGQTPLHCIPIRDAALVNILLNHGADAKHVDYQGNTVLHNMAGRRPPYLPRTRRNDAPRDGVSTINMLMGHGAGMDIRNTRGGTPTMLLAMHNTSVLGLPDAPGIMSYKEPFPDCGWNIMHYAAYYWDEHALAQLNFYEATVFFGPPEFDPDAADQRGRTPLEAFEYRMFVTEADETRMAGVFRPTREEVRLFVSLLRDCRIGNWEDGCYLETKQRFLEDGSQEKMEAWLQQQLETAAEYRSELWQETDSWWRDVDKRD